MSPRAPKPTQGQKGAQIARSAAAKLNRKGARKGDDRAFPGLIARKAREDNA